MCSDSIIFVLVVLILFFMLFTCQNRCSKENLTGFGVTSALAFNNRQSYCQPGNTYEGGSWSGGCFLPHKVIL